MEKGASTDLNQLSWENFSKNPLNYVWFLVLIALVVVYSSSETKNKTTIQEKNNEIQYLKRKTEIVDSTNHVLFMALGGQKVLDQINNEVKK